MPNPAGSDPAEGSREVIDHELARASARRASVKNPENEANRPGGVPTQTVEGSSSGHPDDPEGQQGSTSRKDH
ncbi:MAG TPA: hypothetical protein VFA87_02365 [Rhizomicrobium sp.]|nr:hypothetical protein [Rhizomicrobium sp.]